MVMGMALFINVKSNVNSMYPQFTLNDAPKVISSTQLDSNLVTNEISSLVFQFVSVKDSLVKMLNFTA